MEVTEGALLGGRLRYMQPTDGFRTGIEPVLLAAAVPARPGERVLEAGTGAGAALMCLASRVAGLRGVGVERDPAMAELARRNIAANSLPGLEVVTGDITAQALAGPFDHALANPPWHDPGSTPSPFSRRRLAKQEGDGLAAWVAALRAGLHARSTLTLILPAAQVGRAHAALAGTGFRHTTLVPLWPRAGRAAKLVLLRGALRAGPDRVAPGLVLHTADGAFTPDAEAVLRSGESLAC